MPVAAIILAAGGSRRLGQPKQLLLYRGETLLNRAIRVAMEAGASPVLTVLGAQGDRIAESIQSQAVIRVHNERWDEGMGGSIATGMQALDAGAHEVRGVMLMGCDQPRLTADHLRALVGAFASQTSPPIVASSYAGVRAVPAVFPRETFAALRALRGDKGARSIIELAPCPVVAVEFAGGEVDIDWPEDLLQIE
jgi:molybdenum cofactor cytidylyltransferase